MGKQSDAARWIRPTYRPPKKCVQQCLATVPEPKIDRAIGGHRASVNVPHGRYRMADKEPSPTCRRGVSHLSWERGLVPQAQNTAPPQLRGRGRRMRNTGAR